MREEGGRRGEMEEGCWVAIGGELKWLWLDWLLGRGTASALEKGRWQEIEPVGLVVDQGKKTVVERQWGWGEGIGQLDGSAGRVQGLRGRATGLVGWVVVQGQGLCLRPRGVPSLPGD